MNIAMRGRVEKSLHANTKRLSNPLPFTLFRVSKVAMYLSVRVIFDNSKCDSSQRSPSMVKGVELLSHKRAVC